MKGKEKRVRGAIAGERGGIWFPGGVGEPRSGEGIQASPKRRNRANIYSSLAFPGTCYDVVIKSIYDIVCI